MIGRALRPGGNVVILDHAEQKTEIQNQFKTDAQLQLREFGVYNWQEVSDPDFCAKPKIGGADPINFMLEYEVGEWTTSNMLKEIFDKCNGKPGSSNAECIAIKYMSEVIAFWEADEYCKKFSK